MAEAPQQPDAAVTLWVPRPPHPEEPACWSWPVPPLRDVDEEIALIMARYAASGPGPDERRDPGAMKMAYYEPEVIRWQEFHAGVRLADDDEAPERCAICEVAPVWPARRLVEDHCHDTGQIRGRLCNRCNLRESRWDGPIYRRYRAWHPAAILDAHEMYSGFTLDRRMEFAGTRRPGAIGAQTAAYAVAAVCRPRAGYRAVMPDAEVEAGPERIPGGTPLAQAMSRDIER